MRQDSLKLDGRKAKNPKTERKKKKTHTKTKPMKNVKRC